MEKPTQRSHVRKRKMGRPPILKPWVMALIRRRISAERRRPVEDQLPIKTLAHEIQKELRESGQLKKVPKLGTLEKAISQCIKTWNPIDDPWDIFTLRHKEWEIPFDTLPIVLNFWAWNLHNRDVQITIREGQWAARLSSLANCMPPEFFSIVVDAYATAEMLAESPDGSQDIGQLFDLIAWHCFAKAETDSPELEKLLEKLWQKIRLPQALYLTATSDEATDLRERYRNLGQEIPFEFLGKVHEYLGGKPKGGKK